MNANRPRPRVNGHRGFHRKQAALGDQLLRTDDLDAELQRTCAQVGHRAWMTTKEHRVSTLLAELEGAAQMPRCLGDILDGKGRLRLA